MDQVRRFFELGGKVVTEINPVDPKSTVVRAFIEQQGQMWEFKQFISGDLGLWGFGVLEVMRRVLDKVMTEWKE